MQKETPQSITSFKVSLSDPRLKAKQFSRNYYNLDKRVAKLRSIKRLFPKEELKMMAEQFLQHQKNKVEASCLKMVGF